MRSRKLRFAAGASGVMATGIAVTGMGVTLGVTASPASAETCIGNTLGAVFQVAGTCPITEAEYQEVLHDAGITPSYFDQFGATAGPILAGVVEK